MAMMLRKFGFFSRSVLTLILFSALGVAIGILAVFAWIKLESTSIFVRWELLDSPHSFQHLINANQIELLARAEDGKYYLYDSNPCDGTTDQKCGKWVEWPLDRELNRFRNTIVESECKSAFGGHTSEVSYSLYAKPSYLPQNESAPRECFISLEYYPTGGATLTYYALLENGKIWKWIDKSPAMEHLGTAGLFALVGLVIGIIIWFRFLNFFSQVKSRRAI
jgi:hypothetical protein